LLLLLPVTVFTSLRSVGDSWSSCLLPGGDEGKPRCAVEDAEKPECDDDSLGSTDGAHGLCAHRMTDGDVSLDGKRRD